MSALLYPIQVNKTISYLATIRCEVESYFNVDIKKFERSVINLGGYNLKPDGLKHIRGSARKYFCYLCKIYLGLTNLEIGRYVGIDEHTVGVHFSSLSNYPTEKEEEILLSLTAKLNDKFISYYKLYQSGG